MRGVSAAGCASHAARCTRRWPTSTWTSSPRSTAPWCRSSPRSVSSTSGATYILLGPPGVGKSHLAIALGVAATEAGYRTYFTSAADMRAHLQSAHLEGTALYKLRTYLGPSVLVIDGLGYLPLDQTSATPDASPTHRTRRHCFCYVARDPPDSFFDVGAARVERAVEKAKNRVG